MATVDRGRDDGGGFRAHYVGLPGSVSLEFLSRSRVGEVIVLGVLLAVLAVGLIAGSGPKESELRKLYGVPGTVTIKPIPIKSLLAPRKIGSGRMQQFIATAKESGWLTNGQFAVMANDADRKWLANKKDEFEGAKVIPASTFDDMERQAKSHYRGTLSIKGDGVASVEGTAAYMMKILESDDPVYVNANQHATIMSRYPNAEPTWVKADSRANDRDSLAKRGFVAYMSGTRGMVGAIMPTDVA